MIPGAGPRSSSASLCFRYSLRFHSSFYLFGRPSPSASLIVSNPLHFPNVNWPHPSPTCALLTFPSSSVQFLRSSRQLCHVPFLLNVPVVQLVLPFYCSFSDYFLCTAQSRYQQLIGVCFNPLRIDPFCFFLQSRYADGDDVCRDPSYISVRAAADI